MEQEVEVTPSLGWAAQFFVGGAVLFVVAVVVGIATTTTEYDGGFSAMGWGIAAVLISLLSIGAAFAIGSPLRVVPRWTRWWLGHGELSVVGVLVGLAGCAICLVSAPVQMLIGQFGPLAVLDVNWWLLGIAWAVLAFSVAHFVWPARWSRRGRRRGAAR